MRRKIEFLRQSIIAVIKCSSWIIRNRKLPDYVLWTAGGIGDHFLLTAVVKSMEGKCVWIITPYTDLFQNNPNISLAIKVFSRYCCLFWPKRILANLVAVSTQTDHPVSKETGLPIHVIHNKLALLGLSYDPSKIDTPALHLTSREKKEFVTKEKTVVIQSSGRGAKFYIPSKEWDVNCYQELVIRIKVNFPEVGIIQLGTVKDPFLEGTIDMRGKTTLREAGAILYNSTFYIGNDGFLMHLAASVNKKSIVIFGGRALPEHLGYPNNINIVSKTKCSPCYSPGDCLNEGLAHMECMKKISVDEVYGHFSSMIQINEN